MYIMYDTCYRVKVYVTRCQYESLSSQLSMMIQNMRYMSWPTDALMRCDTTASCDDWLAGDLINLYK